MNFRASSELKESFGGFVRRVGLEVNSNVRIGAEISVGVGFMG
jgi:hypothetical protein